MQPGKATRSPVNVCIEHSRVRSSPDSYKVLPVNSQRPSLSTHLPRFAFSNDGLNTRYNTTIMAEIFGAVAAGIAVCHELSRLAKVIQEVTKKVQNARKDISDLSDEAIIFTGLYETFLQSCESNPEACAGAASSISCLKSWAESTVKDLGKLLDQLDPLRLDTAYRYSLSHTIKSHWKWLVSTKSVNLLRVSLNVARQSISGFSNLMCFEKLNEELKILRKALTNPRERRKIERKFNMRLKDKIEMVKNRMLV